MLSRIPGPWGAGINPGDGPCTSNRTVSDSCYSALMLRIAKKPRRTLLYEELYLPCQSVLNQIKQYWWEARGLWFWFDGMPLWRKVPSLLCYTSALLYSELAIFLLFYRPTYWDEGNQRCENYYPRWSLCWHLRRCCCSPELLPLTSFPSCRRHFSISCSCSRVHQASLLFLSQCTI